MDPFAPIKIGDVEIKNRFALAPMISNLADVNGYTNDIHQAYLEERAIGGYGLIITEYSHIDSPFSKGSRNQLSFVSLDQVPSLKRLTERIHSHGSKIFAQLVHAGGKALTNGNERPFAPSEVPYLGKIPMELKEDQLEQIREAFLKAAKIAEMANFDGVELHGAHAYLLQEFLSPSLNKRTDKYGRDFEGRLRFPQEIINSIREETSMAVGIRLSQYEDEVDGYNSEYGLRVAESLKNLDYVHLSAGRMAPPGSSASYFSPYNHIGMKLPRKPRLTTIAVGSILNMDSVKRALEKSDMVSMARGALADPFFPIKLKNGITPRPCIRCNQGCRDLSFGQVRCTVNPITGNETHYNEEISSGEVSVAGAGVSGLECSIYLRKTGYNVTLYEEEGKIGGKLNEYNEINKAGEINKLLDFYKMETMRLGISVVLSTKKNSKEVDIFLPGFQKYPEINKIENEIHIDSNIYEHLDKILELSKTHRIYITERSLRNLDRHRQIESRKLMENAGIHFEEFDTSKKYFGKIERNQYDIYQAALRGINAARDFIMLNRDKVTNSSLP